MGRRGPLPKRGQVQGHRSKAEQERRANLAPVIATIEPTQKVPRAPAGLSASTRRDWREFWESEQAQLVNVAMMPSLRRLFRLRDEQTKALDTLSKTAQLVKGSTGQLRTNPLAELALKLETAIFHLEQQIGLMPAAGARLLTHVAGARRSLEDLHRDAVTEDELGLAVVEHRTEAGGDQPPARKKVSRPRRDAVRLDRGQPRPRGG